MLCWRYERLDLQDDLLECITASRSILDEIQDDVSDLPLYNFENGMLLRRLCFNHTHSATDLNEASNSVRRAIRGVADDDENRPMMLFTLGGMLRAEYFDLNGGTAGLEATEAIRVAREAADTVPENHPKKAQYLGGLGLTMAAKFDFTDDLNDLEGAIEVFRRATSISQEVDPNRAWLLSDLGYYINKRHNLTNSTKDRDEAIALAKRVLEITSHDHEDRNEFVIRLARWRTARHEITGSQSDLEADIEVLRDSLKSTPAGHPSRANLLKMLGNRLQIRYHHLGTMADIDESVRLARQAVDLASDSEDRQNYLTCLYGLGGSLYNRHQVTQALVDIDEAIAISTKLLEETPLESPERPVFVESLGRNHRVRYVRTNVVSDLDKAIELTRTAMEAPISHYRDLEHLLPGNLSQCLLMRFLHTREAKDLDEAIQMGRKAVSVTPRDHIDWPCAPFRLADCLGHRYLETKTSSDLNEAIALATQAVDAIGEHHRFRSTFLSCLAGLFSYRFAATDAKEDVQHSIFLHQTALSQTQSPIKSRLNSAKALIIDCKLQSMWDEAYEAAKMAIDLIPKLTLRSLQPSDKQALLTNVSGVASEGAGLALRAGEIPFIALNSLEKGRGVMALSLEDAHIDTTRLEETHPDLARRFVHLGSQLGGPDTAQVRTLEKQSAWNSESNRSYEAADEFEKLLLEIRQQHGFENFLLAPTESEVKSAARYGPIVVVNCSLQRCDAILIELHQVRSLHLPHYSRGVMLCHLEEGTFKSSGALEWLWHCIAEPVLSALGFDKPPKNNNWPRVWWVMTGNLGRFPIHAAGIHEKGSSETVIDRVISSYHTSVQSIIRNRNRKRLHSPDAPNHAVLVAMEHTPGSSALPFAPKEIIAVRGICESISLSPVEPPPRKEDILSQLAQCDVFHFAGHARTDSFDPAESYLSLDNTKAGSLTVSNLLNINRQRGSPFLAYLSACGTGEIEMADLSDEAIHLITGFQLAGFRHVIGTLWEVKDDLCVDMARITYEELRDKGLTDESVSWGLHKATRELRDRWISEGQERAVSRRHRKTEAKKHDEASGSGSGTGEGACES